MSTKKKITRQAAERRDISPEPAPHVLATEAAAADIRPPSDHKPNLRADIDRSIMEAFGHESTSEESNLPSVDAQRKSLASNTHRLDDESILIIYRIAYWQGCSKLFVGQKPGTLAINLGKIPDDVITMMYLQMSIFLEQRKTHITSI